MKRAVIITGHFPFQKRRGSILWVSQHLQEMGWHVTHVTVGYSWLSVIKPDQRLTALDYKPKTGVQVHSTTLSTIFGFSPLHPVRTGHAFVDQILARLKSLFINYWRPRLRKPLREADLVICESGAPVLLGPLLTQFAPTAARVYRVNDDIRLLNAPDHLINTEHEMLPKFSRVSSANMSLTKRFMHQNTTIDAMGVPNTQLKKPRKSPYMDKSSHRVAVCGGTTQLDQRSLRWIAQNRPNWQIHVLGRVKKTVPIPPKNITFHGEISFEEVLDFIAFADIGLAPYIDKPGIEYQTTNSNRMLLHRFYGLPILGPDRLCNPTVPNIIGYSEPNALDRCEVLKKQPESIPDWSELALSLAQNGEIEPPTDVSCDPETSVWLRM